MAKVRKANTILDIKDSEVDRYIDLGYVQIDEKTGEIIKEGIPQEIERLKEAYIRLTKENKELKEKLALAEKKINVDVNATKTVKKKRTVEE